MLSDSSGVEGGETRRADGVILWCWVECRSWSHKTCVQILSLPLPDFPVLTVTQPLRVKCSAVSGLLSLTRGLMCLTLL